MTKEKLKLGIWSFHSAGMGLFFKVVREDPFIFGADDLEGYLAVGAED